MFSCLETLLSPNRNSSSSLKELPQSQCILLARVPLLQVSLQLSSRMLLLENSNWKEEPWFLLMVGLSVLTSLIK